MIKQTSKFLRLLLCVAVLGGGLFLSSCGDDKDVKPTTVAVTGVTVTPDKATLQLLATQQLAATIAPENASNKKLAWTSSSNAIATVDANGLVTAVAAGTATITATSEDGAKTGTTAITVTEFSTATVEQNKSKLEENGIALVNDLTNLKEAEGVKTAESLVNLLLGGFGSSAGRQSVATGHTFKVLQLLSKFKKGQATPREVMAGMKTAEDGPSSPQEAWNEVVGTYTYNFETQEFDTTATGGTAIIFQFPSTEEGLTNNAELKIFDFTYVTINNPELEYQKDVPTGLKFTVSVDQTKQIEYLFAATYKDNGEPKTLATSLFLNPYKFSVDLLNTSHNAAFNYKLTKSDNNLISYGAEAWGDFTSTNLDVAETPGDVADSVAAYIQVLNIKFYGKARVKAIDDALGDNSTSAQEVAAFNANARIWVLFADTNAKIAVSEFYVDNTDQEAHTEIRLVFGDGSKSDVKTYINEGFADLEADFKELLGIDSEEG
jgi:hypothetical protein